MFAQLEKLDRESELEERDQVSALERLDLVSEQEVRSQAEHEMRQQVRAPVQHVGMVVLANTDS